MISQLARLISRLNSKQRRIRRRRRISGIPFSGRYGIESLEDRTLLSDVTGIDFIKEFTSEQVSEFTDIIVTDESAFVSGSMPGPGGTDGFVYEISLTTGQVINELTVATDGEDAVNSLAVDGNYLYYGGIVGGSFEGQVYIGGKDAFLTQRNLTTGEQKTVMNGGPGDDILTDIGISPEGPIVTIQSNSPRIGDHTNLGDNDILLLQLDDDLLEVRSSDIATAGNDTDPFLTVAPDGNIGVTGTTDGDYQAPRGGDDQFFAVFNSNLENIARRQLGTSSNEKGAGIAANADNTFTVIGSTLGAMFGPNQGGHDITRFKASSTGSILGAAQVGGDDSDFSKSIMSEGAHLTFIGTTESSNFLGQQKQTNATTEGFRFSVDPSTGQIVPGSVQRYFNPDHDVTFTGGDSNSQGIDAFIGAVHGAQFFGFNGANIDTNKPPTFTLPGDITVHEDSGPHTFTIEDISDGSDPGDQPLELTVTSSNTDLIPHPAVDYTSPALTGTFTFTPLPNQFGNLDFEFTLIDGGNDFDLTTPADNATTTGVFTVTITPVNDPPTIDPIADVDTDTLAGEVTVPITGITAGPGEIGPVTLTATTDKPSLFSGPITVTLNPGETDGELKFTPNRDQTGTGTVTVTVKDPGDDGIPDTDDDGKKEVTFTVTVRGWDFGDLPDADVFDYPTLLENNGPRHLITGDGPEFTSIFQIDDIDPESDGQPTALADGDNQNGTDDEGAIFVTEALAPGETAEVSFWVTAPGYVSAWIDFNHDKTFSVSEQIAVAKQVEPDGARKITFSVPADAIIGKTGARFRITSDPTPLLPIGAAIDGEVEDLLIAIEPSILVSAVSPDPVIEDGIPQNIEVVVTLSEPSDEQVTVEYYTEDLTANSGEDYLAQSGTVTFAPGDVEESINITIIGDNIDERTGDVFNQQFFFVKLKNPIGARLPRIIDPGREAFVRIIDDDVSLPSRPDLNEENDSGASDADNITNQTMLTIAGTAMPKDDIELFDGDTSLGTTTADADGNWSFMIGPLSEGDHSLFAQASDTVTVVTSNSTETYTFTSALSFPLNLTIDTSGPTGQIGDVTPNPRTEPVGFVIVNFNEPINTDSFMSTGVKLLLDGTNVPLEGNITISSITGRTFRIDGLAPFTAETGTFTIQIDMAGIRDIAGNAGNGTIETFWENVNDPPNILGLDVDHPQNENEGPTKLTVKFEDDNIADTHTVEVTWGDGATETRILPIGAREAEFEHRYLDDPEGTQKFYSLKVKVTDSAGEQSVFGQDVIIENVAPQIREFETSSSRGDDLFAGDTLSLSAAFVDPGIEDEHTARIFWGDGTAEDVEITTQQEGSTFIIGNISSEHSYAESGRYEVTLTVEDGDSITSHSQDIFVTGFRLRGRKLQIVGTNEADRIRVTKRGRRLVVKFPSFSNYSIPIDEVDRIEVYSLGGEDRVTVASDVTLPVFIDGGDDDDRLNAGGGTTVLVGQDGDDRLNGGPSRDILIGGRGADALIGRGDEDILISGHTNSVPHPDGMQFISDIWNRKRPRDERIASLASLDEDIVFIDGDADTIFGNPETDWFIISDEDEIRRRRD